MSALGDALLSEYESAHQSWSAPASRYARLLTAHSAEHLARMAQLYGLKSFEEAELVPPLRAALVALDPWPDRGGESPFVWDDGLAFIGLTALFAANGDVLIHLLTRWEDGTEPLPLIESVVDTLIGRSGGEREQALVTARRLLRTRQAPGSQAWRDLGRPWLEPLLELGLLRTDVALKYSLTPRGAALAVRWRETPMPVEQRLSEALAEDWVIALGHTPRDPTDEELLATLAACPNFGEPGERVARLEELALWTQATWIRSAPGVCASAATLRRLIGRVGFTERAGVEFGSGLMSYESFVRWTGQAWFVHSQEEAVDDARPQDATLTASAPVDTPHAPSLDDADVVAASTTALLADDTPPDKVNEGALAPTDDSPSGHGPLEPTPALHEGDAAVSPRADAPLHFRAWRRYARTLLETPGALALGGPTLWLRQLDELLSDPAASHLLNAWRKEEHWPRGPAAWCVEATLLAGLVELKNVECARKLPEVLPFLTLLRRWQDAQADIERVHALRHECTQRLGDLQRALLGVLRHWLLGAGRRSELDQWPEIRRVTRWLLADAALLGGHSRAELIGALNVSTTEFERLAALLAPQRHRAWEATETFSLLGDGLDDGILDQVRDEVERSFVSRAELTLRPATSPLSDVGSRQWAWTATASLKAPSEDRAYEEAVLLFESARARARHVLARDGIQTPRVIQSERSEHRLRVGLEIEDDAPAALSPPNTSLRARGEPEPPDPQALGIVFARPPVETPAAFKLFDDALLSLSRANEGDGGGNAATQITLIWVALERLQPSNDRDRASKVQQRASRLMARIQLAAECGDVLRRAFAALHKATLASASPNREALSVWRCLCGAEEEERYAALSQVLANSREQLFGGPLAVNDEDAMQSLAKLSSAPPSEGEGSRPLDVLMRIAEAYDPTLALDLRYLCDDLSEPKRFARRLSAERLLIAGAIHRAYRVRNRLVHASDTGLGEDRALFAELRDHLIPMVDRLLVALMHPRCAGLQLAERWAMAHERLDRAEPLADEKYGKAVTLPDLLARSAWGTSD